MFDFVHDHRVSDWFLNLGRALTTPAPEIQRADERRQAQLIATMMVTLAPVMLLLMVVLPLIWEPDTGWSDPHFWINIGGLGLIFSVYRLSRKPHYQTAALLLIVGGAVLNLLEGYLEVPPDPLITAVFAFAPLLLSSVLLSLRQTILVTVLQGLGVGGFFFLPGSVNLFLALSLYVIGATLILILTWYRNLLEADRHTELERRVQERTAELSTVNERLRQQMAERERAEAALLKERNLLHALVENLPDLVFALDRDGHYLLDNQAHRQVLGVQTLEEIVGKGAFDFFSENDAKRFVAEEQTIITTGEPLLNSISEYQDLEGQTHSALINKIPFRDGNGKIIGLVGIARDITEIKRAETGLRQAYSESERRITEQKAELGQLYSDLWYQANLLENVSDAVIATDLNQVIRSWNKAAETIYGWSAEEAIGKRNHDLVQSVMNDDQKRAAMQQFAETGYWQGESIHRRRDGSLVELWVSSSYIRNSNGQPTGMVTVNRDITQRKQAQAAEREQRQLAEALRDTAAAINSTLELDEVLDRIFLHIVRILPCDTANLSLIEGGVARVVRFWGATNTVSEQEIRSHGLIVAETPTLRQIVETGSPLLVPNVADHPGWVRNTQTPHPRSYLGVPIKIQGEVVGFLNANAFQPNYFREEQIGHVMAFAEQIGIAIRNARLYDTARRHAGELAQRVAERTAELERERAQLQVILDSMNDGVISLVFDENLKPRPLYLNRALYQMTGYELSDWGSSLQEKLVVTAGDDEILYRQVLDLLQQDGLGRAQFRLRRKDGTEMDVEVTFKWVGGQGDHILTLVAVIRDIGPEKILQEQRSRFVANASHELRTPITNLLTRLYLVRRQPAQMEEHLTVLESVANRMRGLVEDLLDVSRFEHGIIPLQPNRMDLSPVVQEVVDLQQPEASLKHIQLSYELPETPLWIQGDQRRIYQVITNLVTNALHYTPDNGCVRVYAQLENPTMTEPPAVTIYVEDTGIGISPEHLPHLFEPFYRVKGKGPGTGLGLTIAKEIVEMHGGCISVQSDPERGSRFAVRFLLAESPIPMRQ